MEETRRSETRLQNHRNSFSKLADLGRVRGADVDPPEMVVAKPVSAFRFRVIDVAELATARLIVEIRVVVHDIGALTRGINRERGESEGATLSGTMCNVALTPTAIANILGGTATSFEVPVQGGGGVAVRDLMGWCSQTRPSFGSIDPDIDTA